MDPVHQNLKNRINQISKDIFKLIYVICAARMTCTGLRVTVSGMTSAGRTPPIPLLVS